ncbi:MAG: hypothetical protein HC836_47420 [Richelia sp. RM2_1_2]|nr:hypothetical protein [Richelia sp. RM2_1_2]
MLDGLKSFIVKLNESGVPLPMVRTNGKPSLTATLVFLSFNMALLGQLGKISNFFGDIDLTQSNYLLLICLSAYLGRRMQKNSDGTVSLEGVSEEPKEKGDIT